MRPSYKVIGITVGLIITLGPAARCRAQGTQGASSPTATTSTPGVGKRVTPVEIKHEVLPKAPTDLKVPLPPDANYMAGYRSQYSTTKLITEIRFKTGNTVAAVADWYEKSLGGSGWKVNQIKSANAVSGLIAIRNGVVCTLHFRSSDPKTTTVMLNYSEAR